jgi:hypothetical protein
MQTAAPLITFQRFPRGALPPETAAPFWEGVLVGFTPFELVGVEEFPFVSGTGRLVPLAGQKRKKEEKARRGSHPMPPHPLPPRTIRKQF